MNHETVMKLSLRTNIRLMQTLLDLLMIMEKETGEVAGEAATACSSAVLRLALELQGEIRHLFP